MILRCNLNHWLNFSRKVRWRQKHWQWRHFGRHFFSFIVNLEQSQSRSPDTWSIIFIFSLIIIFYLKNWKHNQNIFVTALFLLSKGSVYAKKMLTLAKVRGSWHRKVYFLSKCMCVLTYTQKFNFSCSRVAILAVSGALSTLKTIT